MIKSVKIAKSFKVKLVVKRVSKKKEKVILKVQI